MAQSSSRLLRRLNPFCAQALSAAATLCQSRGHGHITIEHWLLKLLGQGDGDLVLIGRRYEWDIEALWTGLLDHLDRLPRSVQAKPQLCDKLQRLIKNAWVHASLDEDNEQLRSAHVLAALIESPDLLACVEAWPLLSVSEVQLRHLLPLLDEHSDERPQTGQVLDLGPDVSPVEGEAGRQENPVLARFTQDITDKARKGEIDPVLGRDDEIRQVIDILSRRRKNNPILVGEPGVGKTALVEGLALRIAEGNVPASLKPVSVRTLDLGLLQAGAGVKGEFEQRLKDVIEAVQQAEHPVLLFIDEAHTLIGAGNQAGGADAANLLKPALARGELRTIAATTWSEYKQYFERDPALERRFQTVKVDEPDDATAMIMLRGLKARYASHHGVHIEDAAIQAAVVLSRRYLPGRQLPDKAVDLLDTASARVRMSLDCEPQALIASKARQSALEQERQALQDDQRINGRNADERLAAIAKQLLSLSDELGRLQHQHANEFDLAQTLLAARDADAFDADTCADLQAQLKTVQGHAPLLSLDVDDRSVAQGHEHEFLAKAEVLQQQLIATEGAVTFGPEPVVIAKALGAKTSLKRLTLRVSGLTDIERLGAQGQRVVQRIGHRRRGVQIQRDAAQIQLAPVAQGTAGKTQADHRAAVRLLGQAHRIQGQRAQGQVLSGGVTAARALGADGLRLDFKAGRDLLALLHLVHVGLQLDDGQRRDRAQVMGPQQADQTFGQLRQVIVELFPQASHEERETFEQPLDVGIVSAGLVQIQRGGAVGKRLLGADLLEQRSLVIKPGEGAQLNVPLNENAGAIAVVALFREPDLQRNDWRLLLNRDELDPDRPRIIELGESRLTLRPLAEG